jgi:N-methylhydantoinase A
VCYGKGGKEPTVTDAHLVLGRINPDAPIAGGMRLDVEAARLAIGKRVGDRLGLSVEAAAGAILTVANNRIAGAIRRVSIDRGHDPRDFALFAFGGGGPLMVSFLLEELGMDRGIVPVHPGITSAWGCAIADLRRDFVAMINHRLSEVDVGALEACFEAHLREGEAFVRGEGLFLERVVVQREADLSYEGQTHVIRTPLPSGRLTREGIAAHFRAAYLRYYGRVDAGFGGLEDLLEQMPIRLLNLRTSVVGVRPDVVLKELLVRPETSVADAHLGDRSVYVGDGFSSVPTYARSKLPWGTTLRGPAVIEQADTTVWLSPDVHARVDEGGNLLVKSVSGAGEREIRNPERETE